MSFDALEQIVKQAGADGHGFFWAILEEDMEERQVSREESMEPVLANMILACKVPVNIMYASTRDVGGKAMGQMIIQLPEDEADAARALHYLKTVKIPFEEVRENDL